MKSKVNVVLTLLALLIMQISFAQENKVAGMVTDEKGVPLLGVTIIVKGSSGGTTTDFDGNFK